MGKKLIETNGSFLNSTTGNSNAKDKLMQFVKDTNEKYKNDFFCQDTVKMWDKERSQSPRTVDEQRAYYKKLLYDLNHNGGVHANWSYIVQWLEDHPEEK